MMACLDVAYREPGASAAGVTFRDWSDASATEERVVQIPVVQPYEPGRFFLRELPCLLAVLQVLPPVELVVIDGYVWLERGKRPGLGAHLYTALDQKIPVVGVAKTRFRGADLVCEIRRGTSSRPLFVTAAGMPAELAAEHVRSMHGKHRIPTLLARVDQLCRQHEFE
jgi:deoxyribonuclease V